MQHGQRILVLTPRFPYPVIGGDRLRIYHLCRQLATRHELTLLSLCSSRAEMAFPVPPDGVFHQVERVLLPTWRAWLDSARALAGRTPLQIAYYRSPALLRAARRLAPSHNAVLAHLIRTADCAIATGRPCILEMTDAISMSMQRVREVSPARWDPRRWIYRVESARLEAYEQRVAAAFDIISLTSAVDRDHLFPGGAPPRARLLVVPNGVTVPERLPADAGRDPCAMCFLGNMRTLQNLDAAWHFAIDVLPRLRLAMPAASLRIVGPIAPADRRRLAALPGVVVTGQVDELGTELGRVSIGVCPIRIGAGVQNKLLDYLAHGLAAVTSPVGLEGLDAEDGIHLRVADTTEQWIDRLSALMRAPRSARLLGLAGRDLVAARYRWDACTRPLLDAIDSLGAGTGEPAPLSAPGSPGACR